jgi:predicted DNA-binding transcriptional regulator AlpA
MKTETSKKAFLEPEDLVEMGLFKDTGQVFRAIKAQINIPPHVRLSKKTIRFPREDFCNWLLQQKEGRNNTQVGEVYE